MWLRKDQGGCEIAYHGAVYAWEQDGDVTDVPHELGVDLVQLGGYQVVPPPEPEGEDAQGDGSAGEAPGGEAGQAGPEPEPAKPAASRRRKGSAAAGNDQA